MRAPRLPDWMVYVAVVAALAGAAILTAPRPMGAGRIAAPIPYAPLAAPSPSDPESAARAPMSGAGVIGTAFSVDRRGVWLTARHIVEGCPHVALVVAPGRGLEAQVRLTPGAETAVLVSSGGAPPLPLSIEPLRHGESAAHVGYPGGQPGEVSSRLIGRQTLLLRGRQRRRERVLVWAQAFRPPWLRPELAGLSGSPALDQEGRVIGVTVAQSRRRGRLYTTTPAAVRSALIAGGVVPAAAVPGPIPAPEDLRRRLSIVEIACLAA